MSEGGSMEITEKQRAEMERVSHLVESHLQAEGLDLEKIRVKTDDGLPAWTFVQGSVLVRVYLRPGQGKGELVYFQAVAPVVLVPDEDREAFFEELLGLNADTLWSCAFAIRDGVVLITADRTTTDLDLSEVVELVESVAAYAVRFDDELADRFSAVRFSDAHRAESDG